MAHVLEKGRQFDNFMFNIDTNTFWNKKDKYLCELIRVYMKYKFICLNLRNYFSEKSTTNNLKI